MVAVRPPTGIGALADATLSILRKLGEDFTLIDENCCGLCCSASVWDEGEVRCLGRGT